MDGKERLSQCAALGRRADDLDFGGADLSGALLRALRMSNCRLAGANLENTDWATAVLRRCALNGVHGDGACFDDARMEANNFEAADLTQASFRRAQLHEISFERASLRYAMFDGARGDGLQFRGATLRDVSMAGVRFEDADFRGADLRNADFKGAYLPRADFRGALLDYACFDGAQCVGAEFDREIHQEEGAPDRAARHEVAALLWQYLHKVRPDTAAIEPLLRELEALTEGQGSVEALSAEFRKLSEQTLAQLGESMPPEDWEQLFAAMGMRTDAPFDTEEEPAA